MNPWWAAPLVAVLGWFVVRRFQKKSEDRKEIRDQINAVTKLVEEVQEASYKYYSKPGNDPEILEFGQEIRCKGKQIGARVFQLNQALPSLGFVTQAIKFRNAASIRLDDAARPAVPNDDSLYENVFNTGATLVMLLEQAFRKKFD